MKYSVYSVYKRFSALNIDNIGVSDESDITHFGPDARGSSIVFYVLNGKGYFNGNLVCKGQGFLHLSKAFEEYYADENEPWTLLWVATDDSAMKAMTKYFKADKETCIFNCDLTPVVPNLLKKLKKYNRNKLNRAEMLEIFMSIFKYNLDTPESTKHKATERTYIDYAVNYIQMNYHTRITVADLTNLLGISQPYLFKIFKNHFNKSPKQYITEFRIEQAKRLLDETDMPINQIASAVGYSDYFAFAKMFREKWGYSPKGFRFRHSGPNK